MDCSEIYNRKLNRLLTLRRTGLVLTEVVRTAGLAVLAFAIYGLLDYFMAFSSQTRAITDIVIIFTLAGLAAARLPAIFRISPRDMALILDRRTANRRREILGACDLAAAPDAPADSLTAYLREQAVHQGISRLDAIPSSHALPATEFRRALRNAALQLLAALLLIALNPPAAGVIARRILFPGRDIPPYSRYVFSVSPANPRVVYGGTIELGVKISGGALNRPVVCHTLANGHLSSTTCFREEDRFIQRLEHITQPLEFWFSAGKARSRRHRLAINYQPEIAAVSATITPPPYSSLPPRRIIIGTHPLKALPGSRIQLTVTSNRELIRGTLALRPADDPANLTTIQGSPAPGGSIAFNWLLTGKAELSIRVFDRTGTANREPLKLRQIPAKDQPPEATLISPPAFSLATPQSIIPIRGSATDDLGLRFAALGLSLTGYRDRFRDLPAAGHRELDIKTDLNLAGLGVAPGQTLEFYLETADLNPDLTGITDSDIVRVKIISTTEYRDMLRLQTTIAEFAARFNEADKNLEELRRAIEDLQNELRRRPPDKQQINRQLDQLRKTLDKTGKVFKRLEKDFVLYDIEEKLKKQLHETNRAIDQHSEWLQKATADTPQLAQKADRLMTDLLPRIRDARRTTRQAKKITATARLLQQAAIFNQLIEAQSEIVRRLDRARNADPATRRALLKTQQKKQQFNRESLLLFLAQVRFLAAKLPPEQAALADDARAFADAVEIQRIPELMEQAETACLNTDAAVAWRQANEALRRMKELVYGDGAKSNKCNKGKKSGNLFASACRGGGNGECDGLGSTLAEMLQNMLSQCRAKGTYGNSGTGLGGYGASAASGAPAFGRSPLNTPVFGPGRSNYIPNATAPGRGTAGASGSGSPAIIPPAAREIINATQKDTADSKSMLIEELPAAYRQAIKEYFSQ